MPANMSDPFDRSTTPTDLHPELSAAHARVLELRNEHLVVSKRFLGAAEGQLYFIDMFLMGVTQRSLHIVDAFLRMFDTWNTSVIPVLVRMQLDNLVRASYVAKCKNSDGVAREVLKGTQFRFIEDDDGKKLTDRRLNELAASTHGWIAVVYEKTSGWVHFSSANIAGAMRVEDEGKFFGRIGFDPGFVPLSFLEEALGAITQATEELFEYIEDWAQRKGKPPKQ